MAETPTAEEARNHLDNFINSNLDFKSVSMREKINRNG